MNDSLARLFLPNSKDIYELSEPAIVSCTLWGEARGEVYRAILGVASVIYTRYSRPTWAGNSPKSVCLKEFQFSCWNENDPNRKKLLSPLSHDSMETWKKCVDVTIKLLNEDKELINLNRGELLGADSYFSFPLTSPPKVWGNCRFVSKIGGLSFYDVKGLG